jgi:hypothetical protein
MPQAFLSLLVLHSCCLEVPYNQQEGFDDFLKQLHSLALDYSTSVLLWKENKPRIGEATAFGFLLCATKFIAKGRGHAFLMACLNGQSYLFPTSNGNVLRLELALASPGGLVKITVAGLWARSLWFHRPGTGPGNMRTWILSSSFPHRGLSSEPCTCQTSTLQPSALDFFFFFWIRVSLCSPGRPWTWDPPTSAFLVLGLQACTIMPALCWNSSKLLGCCYCRDQILRITALQNGAQTTLGLQQSEPICLPALSLSPKYLIPQPHQAREFPKHPQYA